MALRTKPVEGATHIDFLFCRHIKEGQVKGTAASVTTLFVDVFLFEQEYIMSRSGHTRGSTVDLTLFDMATEKELDMGGTFDWFGPESHPDFCGNPDTFEYTGDNSGSPAGRSITPEQFANRMILRKAMLRHGFKPLPSEWWHFTLRDEPFPETYFTFPVKQL